MAVYVFGALSLLTAALTSGLVIFFEQHLPAQVQDYGVESGVDHGMD
jgi:hypothetical protein